MRSNPPRPTTVDAYIAGFPPKVRKRLTAIRKAARRATIFTFLLVGAVTAGAAQEQLRPRGLWGRATFGMSSLDQSCDSCQFTGAGTASNFNLVGGYAWPAVAVGFELGSISRQGNQGDVSLILLTVAWYPWPTSGAFVKGGVGSSKHLGSQDADGIRSSEAHGFGAQFGVGIDLSMGNLGVAPFAFVQYAHQEEATAYGFFPAGRNMTQWDLGFGVGVTVF